VPYANSSNVWNMSLATLHPGGVPIHASTSSFMARVLDGKGATPQRNYLGTDTTQSTLPVYNVHSTTPLQWMRISDGWRFGNDSSVDGSYQVNQDVQVPIPVGLVKPPGYSDYQVILYNVDTGDEWNIWHAGLNIPQTQWNGLDGSGHWIPTDVGSGTMRYTCQNAGLYRVNGGSDNVPGVGGFINGRALPAKTPKAWGSRGAKVPYGIGLVRKWEIDEGVIRHAIAWSYHGPSPEYVQPAQNSDGGNFGGVSGVDLPEGARIRLNPAFDLTRFPAGAARVIGKALQDYGAILIDNSGFPKVLVESDNTAAWTDISASMMSAAALSSYQVIDWTG